LARKTKSTEQRRREQLQQAALETAAERLNQKILEAQAIDDEELRDRRDLLNGAVIYASLPTGGLPESPDPLQGVRYQRDLVAEKLDKLYEVERFAGTPKARAGIQIKEDALWRELQERNATLDLYEDSFSLSGSGCTCRSCLSHFSADHPDGSLGDLCHLCAEAWSRPRN
jgi:hypothetical protein